LSIGGTTVTSSSAFITQCTMETISTGTPSNGYRYSPKLETTGDFLVIRKEPQLRMTIELVCNKWDMATDLFKDKSEDHIAKKRVEDCTIEELLFAVRKKVELGKKE
jgi:hypothetical protein